MSCSAKMRIVLGRLCTISKLVGQHAIGQQRRGVASIPQRLLSSRNYTTNIDQHLLSCVKEEVKLEQEVAENVPEVTGFTATINGCTAKLYKHFNDEKIMVDLDTHHAVEVISDELGDEEEDGEPFFVPAFTVTITNNSGSQMQVDCSFDEHGHYLEQGKEWDNLTIDSISIIPPLTKDAETVYTVTADNLSSEIYDSLLGYLQVRGIDQRFTHEIIQFYQVYEHQCYLEHTLTALRNFLQTS